MGKDTQLLDAGCGSGCACVLAADLGAMVTGVDASEALINIARERFPKEDFRACNIEDLPFPAFSLSQPGVMEKLIVQNGLMIVENQEFDEQFGYSNFETFWQGMKASGPFQGLMRLVSEENLEGAFSKAGTFLQDSNGGVRKMVTIKHGNYLI